MTRTGTTPGSGSETTLEAAPDAAAGSAALRAEGRDTRRRQERRGELGPARARFRDLLGKVGSGEHTSTGLDRAEAREAMELMLNDEASDSQLGAFLIAHRIRRPTPIELTGMLDSYRDQGPRLETPGRRPLCFGVPYDGRSRTAPLLPLVALVLAAAGQPVVLHGGAPMPVKYGVTLSELFACLGVEWRGLALAAVQERLDRQGLALTHQPDHFPAAERLVRIREDIGKRPPVASLELLWTPHRGEHLLVSGFVHPPTESRAWEALQAAGEQDVLTVKGLEGSTDLPTTRAAITARLRDGVPERILLHPREHGVHADEVAWSDLEQWQSQALAALAGAGPLAAALRWNVGAYLWFAGQLESLPAALAQADALLAARAGLAALERLRP
jgi:anthranilate phosphoribosyltransferase